MINWNKIISDYNLSGRYGHFLIYAFGKPVDVVFWHYDKFDYDIYCPSLDKYSELSNLQVTNIVVYCQVDNFWGCITLDKSDFFSRLLSILNKHGIKFERL